MKRAILFIAIVLSSVTVSAQQNSAYVETDSRMMKIPRDFTQSADNIASYIKFNFKTDEQRVRAAFYWITQSITYDVEGMNATKQYDNDQQIIEEVLKNRKGVCGHYATLFSSICNQVGVKTIVVHGLTKQNGKVDKMAHAWNVCFVNEKWQIIDPTWGSGYIITDRYVRKLNDEFFLQKAEKSILHRYPFDPIWQLTERPVEFQDFASKVSKTNSSNSPISYNDSIATYLKLSDFDQKIAIVRRIKNEHTNQLIADYKSHLENDINTLQANVSIEIFNNAVNIMNQGIADLNEFIAYRNKQFLPKKADAGIQLMLDNVELSLKRYKLELSKIKFLEPTLRNAIADSDKLFEDVTKAYLEQKEFLDKYISTSKMFRKSLFYNYYWMGIPLNPKK